MKQLLLKKLCWICPLLEPTKQEHFPLEKLMKECDFAIVCILCQLPSRKEAELFELVSQRAKDIVKRYKKSFA